MKEVEQRLSSISLLDYDLMFRWIVGLGMDDTVWNHSALMEMPGCTVGNFDQPSLIR